MSRVQVLAVLTRTRARTRTALCTAKLTTRPTWICVVHLVSRSVLRGRARRQSPWGSSTRSWPLARAAACLALQPRSCSVLVPNHTSGWSHHFGAYCRRPCLFDVNVVCVLAQGQFSAPSSPQCMRTWVGEVSASRQQDVAWRQSSVQGKGFTRPTQEISWVSLAQS